MAEKDAEAGVAERSGTEGSADDRGSGFEGDLSPSELRAAFHRAADLAADYLLEVERYPVLPRLEPGAVVGALPDSAPESPEEWDQIFEDYRQLIEPAVTHWNHPGFFGYFAISGSAPGIVGETLAAALNVNAMLWQTSPAATELEETVCDWLRQAVGLPPELRGHINDTASIGTLLALGAARHRACPEVRERGLTGVSGRLVVYASDQAHSSVDKSMIALGLGLDSLRQIRSDRHFRLDPKALQRALDEDLAAGRRPIAVVATAGTTSTTSFDPIPDIADLCQRYGLWLHVDAAYGGAAALCPEHRPLLEGWERADSVVTNPHKWLFVPVDCSVLYVREPRALRAAYSVVPAYLESPERARNLMDLGIQLGRRFRALKLWLVIRRFGLGGLRSRLRHHCDLAAQLRRRVEESRHFECLAPTLLSVVCFGLRGDREERRRELHRQLAERVNAEGSQLISTTELQGRSALRLAIGNLRTERRHVDHAWSVIVAEAERLHSRGSAEAGS